MNHIRHITALALALTLALAGAAQASVATPTLRVSNLTMDAVGRISLTITPSAGSYFYSGGQCYVVLTDAGAADTTLPADQVSGTTSAGVFEAQASPALTPPYTSLVADCMVRQPYTVKVVKYGSITRYGSQWRSRSTGAYSYGGNCNWLGNGSGGLLSTCLFAHAKAAYRLTVPTGKTFVSLTHRVSAGIEPCRNHGWATTHSGRVYTTTFYHGSRGGFSQCVIERSTLTYKWTALVAKTRWTEAVSPSVAVPAP